MPQNPLIAQPKPATYPDFGPWLTYAEAVKSATATRLGIDNTPTSEQYRNMLRVYQTIYVPLCERFGKLPVSSFFRSARLNKAIGGSATSAHLAGNAIDLDCDGLQAVSNKALFEYVRAGNVPYDQILNEFPDANGNPQWVHIGLRATGPNRKQALRAIKRAGRTVYVPA